MYKKMAEIDRGDYIIQFILVASEGQVHAHIFTLIKQLGHARFGLRLNMENLYDLSVIFSHLDFELSNHRLQYFIEANKHTSPCIYNLDPSVITHEDLEKEELAEIIHYVLKTKGYYEEDYQIEVDDLFIGIPIMLGSENVFFKLILERDTISEVEISRILNEANRNGCTRVIIITSYELASGCMLEALTEIDIWYLDDLIVNLGSEYIKEIGQIIICRDLKISIRIISNYLTNYEPIIDLRLLNGSKSSSYQKDGIKLTINEIEVTNKIIRQMIEVLENEEIQRSLGLKSEASKLGVLEEILEEFNI